MVWGLTSTVCNNYMCARQELQSLLSLASICPVACRVCMEFYLLTCLHPYSISVTSIVMFFPNCVKSYTSSSFYRLVYYWLNLFFSRFLLSQSKCEFLTCTQLSLLNLHLQICQQSSYCDWQSTSLHHFTSALHLSPFPSLPLLGMTLSALSSLTPSSL